MANTDDANGTAVPDDLRLRVEVMRHEKRMLAAPRMAATIRAITGMSQQRARQFVGMLAPATVSKLLADADCIISLGNSCYQVAGHTARGLDDAEDAVLKPFVTTPAMVEATLILQSGNARPRQVLKRIASRYPEFSPFIKFPGGKNSGGYAAIVRENSR